MLISFGRAKTDSRNYSLEQGWATFYSLRAALNSIFNHMAENSRPGNLLRPKSHLDLFIRPPVPHPCFKSIDNKYKKIFSIYFLTHLWWEAEDF